MASFIYSHPIGSSNGISYTFIRYLGSACQGYLKTIALSLIIHHLKSNSGWGWNKRMNSELFKMIFSKFANLKPLLY